MHISSQHSLPFLFTRTSLNSFKNSLSHVQTLTFFGKVAAIQGLLIEITGIISKVHLGSTVQIHKKDKKHLKGQVVGFRGDISLVMAYDILEGIQPGARVDVLQKGLDIYPSLEWKGRVLNALAEPLDGKGPLPYGENPYHLKAAPPPAHQRMRTKERIDLGIRALNTFTTCCRGQRMGIFSAAGVGKSVLLGQITRFSECDVIIVGLIGERGREVNEFLEEHLGPEGLKKAIVIVATSDTSALLRRQAAYMTLTLAEYFRDQKLNVLCIIDSVTRFAMAQREIGLSVGEPPTTRGFPPTVFSELPRLLERAGTTHHEGAITGIFSILVEGDDPNEPIADATRSILDGHIILERSIAERGRFPAVNILKSLSRTMPDCNSSEETGLIRRARKLMAIYDDMQEMIQLGAYRNGSSLEVDEAIKMFPKLTDFLHQNKEEKAPLHEVFKTLEEVLAS